MTELKSLGKKLPEEVICGCEEYKEIGCDCDCNCLITEQAEHYRQALIEAAEELESYHNNEDQYCGCDIGVGCASINLAKKLRISAGVEK